MGKLQFVNVQQQRLLKLNKQI